ncbi:uncharacterized protein RJT20DRAFT_64518 [Scheffersomyces xylosifermentans]|uniref:uncharacterized protein n=1 Tax=Scheffersomyces xylosifermentans TaxID=1304137 RepID=UPI00315C76BC
MAKEKRSKNQLRRERSKLRKIETTTPQEIPSTTNKAEPEVNGDVPSSIEDGLITTNGAKIDDKNTETNEPTIDKPDNNDLFEQFKNVFNKFQSTSTEHNDEESRDEISDKKGDVQYSSGSEHEASEEEDESDSDAEEKQLSKRQLRKRNKVPLASLKSSTPRPQLVEWYDVDAQDPYFLVALKSQPNAVPVPGHWSLKREYLASKKGIERLPFELPKFIRDVGIQEMRNNDEQSLRQSQREKVQPKMGRLDIDYQRLHNAFFKFQEKPRLFGYGDVYYEGREATDEYSSEVSQIRPGKISSELRKALGIPDGSPPWISIMQEIGKPPAYESLYIPGLDMPYDNKGYRDSKASNVKQIHHEDHWGKLQDYEESEEEEDEEEDDDEDDNEKIGYEKEVEEKDEKESIDDAHVKVSISEYGGINSKKKQTAANEEPSEDSGPTKSLFTVLTENFYSDETSGLLKGEKKYDLGTAKSKEPSDDSIRDKTTTEPVAESAKKFKF